MMEQKLTHWKKLDNPDYLGAYALQPKEEPIYTIKEVKYERIIGAGGEKEDCRVAYFVEKGIKPMILNTTNSKIIAGIYKTPFIEEWAGKRIQIYVAEIRAFGETMEALRIRPQSPKLTKPILDENYQGWNQALEAVRNKETTIEFLLTKYTIPTDAMNKLKEVTQNA